MTKILRSLQVLCALAFLTLLWVPATRGQDLGGGATTKENLDLPFDALGENEEEEDAPEIVSFYGQQLEGDGFFYVVDSSGSMRDSGELAVAKREIVKNITEFSDRVQFGVVFFNTSVSKFPGSGQPAEANPGQKSSALAWIQAHQGSSGSCCQAGLSAGLQLANACSAKRKVLSYVGDGGGTCGGDESQYLQQTLAAVSAQNFQRVQINCIGVLSYPQMNEDFMRKLSAQNGGTYVHITR